MKGLGFYGQDFLTIKTNQELIRENLIRVLLTSPGERPMSQFGCRLKDFLLEQSTVLRQDVESEIRKSITKWEPRVSVTGVTAEITEENTAKINITCQIKETFEDFNLNTVIRF